MCHCSLSRWQEDDPLQCRDLRGTLLGVCSPVWDHGVWLKGYTVAMGGGWYVANIPGNIPTKNVNYLKVIQWKKVTTWHQDNVVKLLVLSGVWILQILISKISKTIMGISTCEKLNCFHCLPTSCHEQQTFLSTVFIAESVHHRFKCCGSLLPLSCLSMWPQKAAVSR